MRYRNKVRGVGMKILAARIKRQLSSETGRGGHCAIYENELQRIWPLSEENRKAKIEQFANEYGFRLSVYKPGLCAIFEKEPSKIIADNLSKAGWSCGCVSAEVSNGRTFFIAYGHRRDGKGFVARADQRLTAFMELESAIRAGK